MRFELFALFTWLFVLFTFITNYMGALRQAGKCVPAADGILLLGWRALRAEAFAVDAACSIPSCCWGEAGGAPTPLECLEVKAAGTSFPLIPQFNPSHPRKLPR